MRVILISYWFAPAISAASSRASNLARFFKSRGHDVFVISSFFSGEFTADNELKYSAPSKFCFGREIRKLRGWLPQSVDKVIMDLLKICLLWPDLHIIWTFKSIWIAKKLIKKNADVVFVSCPPFSTLVAAKFIAKKRGIPWVADFRDLWTFNHSYNPPNWRRRWDEICEVNAVSSASALVTVSEPLRDSLERLHSQPVWIVKNGASFQKKNLMSDSIVDPTTLVIAYTGTVYYNQYSWRELIECLRILHESGVSLKLVLAGRNTALFQRTASSVGLGDLISCRGLVSFEESARIQKEADLLIFFTWNNSDGIRTSKLSEYVASRRPILMLGGPTDVSDEIIHLGAGVLAENADEACSYLLGHIADKQRNSGRVPDLYVDDISDFCAAHQFEKLEKKLLGLVDV